MIFTGKKVGIGVGLETTRGQKANIAYWMPWTDNTFIDKANVESEAGVVDTLMDSIGSEITKQRAEGTIGGKVYPNGIGFFLKALLGVVATTAKAPANTAPSLGHPLAYPYSISCIGCHTGQDGCFLLLPPWIVTVRSQYLFG